MASSLSLPPTFVHSRKFTRSRSRALCHSNILNVGDQEKKHAPSKTDTSQGFQFLSCRLTSKSAAIELMPPGALSSTKSAAESDKISCKDEPFVSIPHNHEMEFNRVNCLIWVLHESARGFSLAVEAHDLARAGPELAMAWRGVDMHAWHRNIAYQVAVYALLKAAIDVEVFLSHKCTSNPSPVCEILSPKALLLSKQIEKELKRKNPQLLLWFRSVELPRIAGLFIPLLKKWSTEYAGSGVAGTVLAMSCCASIRKLGSRRISRSFFISVADALTKLMTLSEDLASVNQLHHLASEAGYEEEFLLHFGSKILPCKNMEDLEFCIGLVRRKLSAAFQRESLITDKHTFGDKVQEDSLATLGLFSYLGRATRLYLSRMGVKDLDEHSKNFLSYLECGSLLIHPNLSTFLEYHLFMEVVTDEIGWLQFYPPFSLEWCQDRRSRQHMIKAEQEIVLYKVLTTCYDVISGLARYSNLTQQPMNSTLLEFVLNSQSLLSMCMDDYWAAFNKISEPHELLGSGMSNSTSASLTEQMPENWSKRRMNQARDPDAVTMDQVDCVSPAKHRNENLLQKSSRKAISASINAWMGTQLLFIDTLEVIGLFKKQIRGCKMTKRQKKKIKRTLTDFATLVPVMILMLLPVSAFGHAAMLAGIKKYLPCLIPSPYTSERLGLVKQLKRIKRIEFSKRSNNKDSGTPIHQPNS